ncbi:MAG: hypothetical protein JO108_09320 [Acidobacteriaceae bacterium]|nr:hypothetical protein [Acidobacteriaceae bacterium]
MMKPVPTVLSLFASVMLAIAADPAQAQKTDAPASAVTDAEVNMMRKDLRDQKKQIVAANLPLNGDEAAKFWPVYGSYTEETIKINDQRYALIKEYAANYNNMTDQIAASLIRRWLGVDQATTQLRLDWIPKFEQVLGEKKAAMFFQIDHRIGMMVELQLSSQLPLIQP